MKRCNVCGEWFEPSSQREKLVCSPACGGGMNGKAGRRDPTKEEAQKSTESIKALALERARKDHGRVGDMEEVRLGQSYLQRAVDELEEWAEENRGSG